MRQDNTAVLIKKVLEQVEVPQKTVKFDEIEEESDSLKKIKFVDRQKPFKPKSYKQRSARIHKNSKDAFGFHKNSSG